MVELIVAWAAIAIVCAVLAGFIASRKNLDCSFWMAMSFVIPPTVLIMPLISKRGEPYRRYRRLDEDEAET
ncbi:MAG: hypothetical protein ACREC6_11385 [Hyphomicrobiaceae bacterium]